MPEGNYRLPWMRLFGVICNSSVAAPKGNEFSDTSCRKGLSTTMRVQFYSDDALLLDTFACFIAVALKSGRAAIVAVTESHLDGSCFRD